MLRYVLYRTRTDLNRNLLRNFYRLRLPAGEAYTNLIDSTIIINTTKQTPSTTELHHMLYVA